MIIIPRRLWYLFNTIIMLYLYQGPVWIVTVAFYLTYRWYICNSCEVWLFSEECRRIQNTISVKQNLTNLSSS